MSMKDDVTELPPRDVEDWRLEFIDFLSRNGAGGGHCSQCGSLNIEVAPAVVTCPIWDADNDRWTLNGRTYPFAMLICKSCGHVNLYSATLAGIQQEDFGKMD